MRKRLVPFLLVLNLAACLLLGGCGSAVSAAAGASGPEWAPVSAAEPEPAPMPEPEPEPVSYAEEHALPFSPAEDFSAEAVMYNTNDMTLFEPIETFYMFEDVELTDNGGWPVAVSFEYATEWGDWFYNEDLNAYDSYGYTHCTNRVTYPKGYDGLAFYVYPRLESEEDESEASVYLLNNWMEGSILIRADPRSRPDRGLCGVNRRA